MFSPLKVGNGVFPVSSRCHLWSIFGNAVPYELLCYTGQPQKKRPPVNLSSPETCGCHFKLAIFKFISRIYWAFPVKLPSGECHKTSLMISRQWFRKGLCAVRQQSIAWAPSPLLSRSLTHTHSDAKLLFLLCYAHKKMVGLCIDWQFNLDIIFYYVCGLWYQTQ